jgi:hypothetical protein
MNAQIVIRGVILKEDLRYLERDLSLSLVVVAGQRLLGSGPQDQSECRYQKNE